MAKDEASRRVFYSWQSDLPNNTNRALIEKALEQAIKSLAKSGAVELAEVDRDTRGVAGAPNITTTIFDKIAGATAFVADISTVNPEPRATPNPNVLVELGYAFRALGPERVILVFNQAHGDLSSVPFDLRQHRILSYACDADADKSKARGMLAANLESQLSAIFALKSRNELDIRVIVRRGFASQGGQRTMAIVSVEVENHSPQPVFLIHISFLMDGGKWFLPPGGIGRQNTAQVVEPGNSHSLVFREEQVKAWLEEVEDDVVAAVATDKIGRRWISDRAAFATIAKKIRADQEE